MSERWANKMRTMYITGFILLVALLSAPSVYKALTPPLTCNDGIMNRGETAPDLGGPCHFLNPADLKPLVNQWARSFAIVPGLYSSVAYIENPNPNGGIRQARYIFKLYDERNILVAERLGETFIPYVPILSSQLPIPEHFPMAKHYT